MRGELQHSSPSATKQGQSSQPLHQSAGGRRASTGRRRSAGGAEGHPAENALLTALRARGGALEDSEGNLIAPGSERTSKGGYPDPVNDGQPVDRKVVKVPRLHFASGTASPRGSLPSGKTPRSCRGTGNPSGKKPLSCRGSADASGGAGGSRPGGRGSSGGLVAASEATGISQWTNAMDDFLKRGTPACTPRQSGPETARGGYSRGLSTRRLESQLCAWVQARGLPPLTARALNVLNHDDGVLQTAI